LAELNLRAQQRNNGLQIDYDLKGNPAGEQLIIAVVQKHAVSKVNAGENKGRTLSHVQIVRDLQTFDLKSARKGSQNIAIGFNTNDWEIIGFIQNADSGVITAAARTSVITL